MKVFSNVFRDKVISKLGDSKSIMSVGASQNVLEAVNKYKSYLSTTSGAIDSVMSALSMDASMISDNFVDSVEIDFDEEHPVLVELGDDVSDLVIQGFSDACHNGKDFSNVSAVTITNSNNQSFIISDQRSISQRFDGYQILFASTMYPSKVAEGVLLRRESDGKVFLNNFIRTADFVKADAHRSMPNTIEGFLDSLIIMKYHYVTESTIVDKVSRLIGAQCTNIHDDLYDWIRVQVGVSSSDTITELLSTIWPYWNETLYPIEGGKGSIVPIWSLVKDNIESCELNAFILKACNCVTSGVNDATVVTNLVIEATNSQFSSIIRFGRGISGAFQRGGIYGVACYIIEYIKELIQAASREDGIFEFTDNSRLAPKIYLSGLIAAITTSITTVMGLIVSVFSSIIGMAITIISSVVGSIFKSINYDRDSVTAAVNTSEKVLLPIAPYGVLKGEIPVYGIANADLLSLLSQGQSSVYFEIPGGYCMMGPGSFNSDGSIATLRYEAHPSIAYPNTYNLFYYIIQHCLEWHHDSGSDYWCRIVFPSDTERERVKELCIDAWANRWSTSFQNLSNDHLSASDDASLREHIEVNMFIMSLYLTSITNQYVMTTSSYGWFTRSTYTTFMEPVYRTNTTDNCSGLYECLRLYLSTAVDFTVDGVACKLGRSTGQIVIPPSWLQIYAGAVTQIDYPEVNGAKINPFNRIFNYGYYYSELVTYDYSMQCAFFVPKYDANSFWTSLVATLIVTTAVAAATTAAVFAARRVIQTRRAMNETDVARKYQNLLDNPSDQNYMAYRKAVRKNNIWSTFIGGSKFDMESYWHGATNSSAGATTGKSENPFGIVGVITSGKDTTTNTQATSGIDAERAVVRSNMNSNDIESLKLLIAGPSVL